MKKKLIVGGLIILVLGASALYFTNSYSVGGFTPPSSGVTAPIQAGEYGAASIDGDDINSNIAGRSLTLTSASPDTLDIDSEIFTGGFSVNLFATTTADGISTTTEDFISFQARTAMTITGFDCYAVDAGTSTIRASVGSNPLTAGTDILFTTGATCGAEETLATTTFSSTAIAADDWIRIYVSDAEPTGSRPRTIYTNLKTTKDD